MRRSVTPARLVDDNGPGICAGIPGSAFLSVNIQDLQAETRSRRGQPLLFDFIQHQEIGFSSFMGWTLPRAA